MIKHFILVLIIVYVSIIFDLVSSQCGCNCLQFNSCSCCQTTYTNFTYNTLNSTAKVCSSTCADTMSNCYLNINYCNNTYYQAALNATCACTCGFCNSTNTNTTTSICIGIASGTSIGPCVNNNCGVGAYCNTTSLTCICP
uniref:ShKT domain-containing protein n=1 Tax=Acrobeloides nanus TaxID=290746 RepID=A0A914EBD9_9BILA